MENKSDVSDSIFLRSAGSSSSNYMDSPSHPEEFGKKVFFFLTWDMCSLSRFVLSQVASAICISSVPPMFFSYLALFFLSLETCMSRTWCFGFCIFYFLLSLKNKIWCPQDYLFCESSNFATSICRSYISSLCLGKVILVFYVN